MAYVTIDGGSWTKTEPMVTTKGEYQFWFEFQLAGRDKVANYSALRARLYIQSLTTSDIGYLTKLKVKLGEQTWEMGDGTTTVHNITQGARDGVILDFESNNAADYATFTHNHSIEGWFDTLNYSIEASVNRYDSINATGEFVLERTLNIAWNFARQFKFVSFPHFYYTADAEFTFTACGYPDITKIELVNVIGRTKYLTTLTPNYGKSILDAPKTLTIPNSEDETLYALRFTPTERERFFADLDFVPSNSWCEYTFEVVTTFKDGTTTTETKVGRVLITDNPPTFNPTIVDANGVTQTLTGDSSVMVRYWSNAKVTFNMSSYEGTSISEFGVIHDGLSYVNQEPVVIERVQNGTFELYAKDTKDRTGRLVVNTPIVEYIKPTARVIKNQITGEGEYMVQIKGACFDGTFGAIDNEIFVYFRYKEQNATEFSDWILVPAVNIANGTYEASYTLTGLDYKKGYIFQAQIADVLDTVNSSEVAVVSIPIFDWSDKDFNFNVPVTIQGKPVMTGESAGNDNKILWEGNELMTVDTVIHLSEPISEQTSGIVLVFSRSEYPSSLTTHFVPKIMVQLFQGAGQVFLMANNAATSKFGAKYLYLYDTYIEGQGSNDTDASTASGLDIENSYFALRYVIGV